MTVKLLQNNKKIIRILQENSIEYTDCTQKDKKFHSTFNLKPVIEIDGKQLNFIQAMGYFEAMK